MLLEFEIKELEGVPGQSLDYFTEEFREFFENYGWQVVNVSWEDDGDEDARD